MRALRPCAWQKVGLEKRIAIRYRTSVPYEVEFEPQVAKELRDLQRGDLRRVMDRIGGLAGDHRPPGCEKLAGMANAWRLRSGSYRIVYVVDDQAHVVTVTRVGHRREVYRRR